jgi:hypothetical protein
MSKKSPDGYLALIYSLSQLSPLSVQSSVSSLGLVLSRMTQVSTESVQCQRGVLVFAGVTNIMLRYSDLNYHYESKVYLSEWYIKVVQREFHRRRSGTPYKVVAQHSECLILPKSFRGAVPNREPHR